MAKPTTVALARLKKQLGYLKATADYACKLTIPEPVGLVVHSNHELNLESFSDSDWSGNKVHRRSTSSAVHVLNGIVLFTTSRTQRVMSLLSAEAELHSPVSAAADGIYIRECLTFLTGLYVKHYVLVGNVAAKTIAVKRGCGRIRHLNGELLWVQQKTNNGVLEVIQVSTTINVADAGTKAPTSARLKGLLYILGVVQGESFESVGEMEREQMTGKIEYGKRVKSLAKTILRLCLPGELPLTTSSSITDDNLDYGMCYAENTTSLSTWSFSGFAFAAVLAISAVIVMVLYIVYKVYKLIEDMKSKMAEAEENMKSLREEVHGMYSKQDSLTGKVDQMYEVSTEFFNELDDGVKQQQQLTGHLWMGFGRVGGWIRNTRRFLDPEEQRYLMHLNNENMDDYGQESKVREV